MELRRRELSLAREGESLLFLPFSNYKELMNFLKFVDKMQYYDLYVIGFKSIEILGNIYYHIPVRNDMHMISHIK